MVITHAHIKTMENCEYPDGYLQFQNEKILSVGEMAKMPADDEIFDASGKVLLPGFIDSHCHIGMWEDGLGFCLLYTSPSPRDRTRSRMPSSA